MIARAPTISHVTTSMPDELETAGAAGLFMGEAALEPAFVPGTGLVFAATAADNASAGGVTAAHEVPTRISSMRPTGVEPGGD
jgi:hypothetical protein